MHTDRDRRAHTHTRTRTLPPSLPPFLARPQKGQNAAATGEGEDRRPQYSSVQVSLPAASQSPVIDSKEQSRKAAT